MLKYLNSRAPELSIDVLKSMYCSKTEFIEMLFLYLHFFLLAYFSVSSYDHKKTATVQRKISGLPMHGSRRSAIHPIHTRIAALVRISYSTQIISETD